MEEKTLAIIKPDAVDRNLIGTIVKRIEDEGFKIMGIQMLTLTKRQAEEFYRIHREQPFYNSLTTYMSSGYIVAILLSRLDAINRWRGVMGATNPKVADKGTIRHEIGLDIEKNSVHGSDSPETAKTEVSFFFNQIQTRIV